MREVMNVYLEFGPEGRLVYSSTLAHLLGEVSSSLALDELDTWHHQGIRYRSFPSILLLIRATSHQRSLKSVRPHRLSIGYIGADQIYVRERLRLFYWLIPKTTNLWRVGVAG